MRVKTSLTLSQEEVFNCVRRDLERRGYDVRKCKLLFGPVGDEVLEVETSTRLKLPEEETE